jgi:hypothetical protein
MKWFGQVSWRAPICLDADRVPIPIGKSCHLCGELIEAQHRGVVMPFSGGPEDPTEVETHLQCLFRSLGLDRFGDPPEFGSPATRSSVKEVLDEIYGLIAEGREERAVDRVWESFDTATLAMDLAWCRDFLTGIDVSRVSAQVLIAGLTSTRAVDSLLVGERHTYAGKIAPKLLRTLDEGAVKRILDRIL